MLKHSQNQCQGKNDLAQEANSHSGGARQEFPQTVSLGLPHGARAPRAAGRLGTLLLLPPARPTGATPPMGESPAMNRGSAPGGGLRGAFFLPRGPVWGAGCGWPQVAGSPVPKHQVAQPIDVGGQQYRQAYQIWAALHPHGVQQELGREEADEQPQKKAEQGAHGGILSHWPEIATRGPRPPGGQVKAPLRCWPNSANISPESRFSLRRPR